jgi:hypothetical protein
MAAIDGGGDGPIDTEELREMGVDVVPADEVNDVLDGALDEETVEAVRRASSE